MPRDIPVGNGQMLVTFDHQYQLRDLYFPHVGQENHVCGGPCRFGVHADLPHVRDRDRRRRRIAWTYDGWHIEQGYRQDTLATDVRLRHDEMALTMRCGEVVDFHRPVLVRRVEVYNEIDEPRTIQLYHHNDIRIFGSKVGDTAYYDPKLRMMVHYREKRYVMAGFFTDGELRLEEFATGNSGFGGAEGTWRDAEDGVLGGNPIAQGAVDSTIGITIDLPPASENNGRKVVYFVLGCGQSHDDLVKLHRFLHRETPQGVIDRTCDYWRLWCWANDWEFGDLEDDLIDLFRRSLLILRTQIDNNGAIIAANDSDIMQFSRDTYSYLWPRDGALVAYALDLAGYPEITRRFYQFCSKIIAEGGYFLHKYCPDGSPASSWHPWVVKGHTRLPIQEDETALVLWGLWQHYYRYRDIEFVRLMWASLIRPAGDFMARYIDPATGLPLPSYDLWEERWGVHAFTVGAVYGGLMAAHNFAICFGDKVRAREYLAAAQAVQKGFCKHMWSDDLDRFVRRVEPTDDARISRLTEQAVAGRHATLNHRNGGPVDLYVDEVLDSSMFGIYKFGLLPADDARVAKTMAAVAERLGVKTNVGGTARYEDDYYHRVTDDVQNVPGNPWFICTLWMADWQISHAEDAGQLAEALPVLRWVAEHALPSGVLAEQVHPQTNAPLSVSPLTWSHATLVGVMVEYVEKLAALRRPADPPRAAYRQHSRGATRIADTLLIDRQQAYDLTDPQAPRP